MSSSEAPILLTHICRDWRSLRSQLLNYGPSLRTPEPQFTLIVRCAEARSEEV